MNKIAKHRSRGALGIAKHRSRGAFGARLDFRYAFGRDLQTSLADFGKDLGGIWRDIGEAFHSLSG